MVQQAQMVIRELPVYKGHWDLWGSLDHLDPVESMELQVLQVLQAHLGSEVRLVRQETRDHLDLRVVLEV